MIFCCTGSGIRSYFSSTLWNGSFSATILAARSTKESGVLFCESFEFCPWQNWFRLVKSSLIVNAFEWIMNSFLLICVLFFTRIVIQPFSSFPFFYQKPLKLLLFFIKLNSTQFEDETLPVHGCLFTIKCFFVNYSDI